jgi:hypothetical protein
MLALSRQAIFPKADLIPLPDATCRRARLLPPEAGRSFFGDQQLQ